MTFEECDLLDSKKMSIMKLVSIFSKECLVYLNNKFKSLDLNTTQVYILFDIYNHDKINQEQLASKCDLDKGAIARNIKKLEDKNFVYRRPDENNRRQNEIFLTNDGIIVLKKAIDLLNNVDENIFTENIIENELFRKNLKEITLRLIEFNKKDNNEDKI